MLQENFHKNTLHHHKPTRQRLCPPVGSAASQSSLLWVFLKIVVKHTEELLLRAMTSTLYSSPSHIISLCKADLW